MSNRRRRLKARKYISDVAREEYQGDPLGFLEYAFNVEHELEPKCTRAEQLIKMQVLVHSSGLGRTRNAFDSIVRIGGEGLVDLIPHVSDGLTPARARLEAITVEHVDDDGRPATEGEPD